MSDRDDPKKSRSRTTPEGSVRAERMCWGTTERQHG